MKSTNKDMYHSLFFWGVAKIYKCGFAVSAIDWKKVSEKKRKKIEKKTDSVAKKIIRKNGRVKPGLKTKGWFFIMRLVQRSGWNEADVKYWKEKGWTEKKRPWKNQDQ